MNNMNTVAGSRKNRAVRLARMAGYLQMVMGCLLLVSTIVMQLKYKPTIDAVIFQSANTIQKAGGTTLVAIDLVAENVGVVKAWGIQIADLGSQSVSIGERLCTFFRKPGWAPGFMPDNFKPGYDLASALIDKGKLLKDSGGVLTAAHQKANESLVPTLRSTAESLQGVSQALKSLPGMSNYVFITSVAAALFVIIGGLFLVAAMHALGSTAGQEIN